MNLENVQRRTVDTQAYVEMLRSLVEEGHEVSMMISGSSMSPFLIHHRDMIYFRQPDRALRRGDMVFYQRENGQYVMHRILRVHPDETYEIIGDNQTEIEYGVRREQIFALITKVKRKGKMMGPRDFWWEFFAGFWLSVIPLRRVLSRAYAGLIR